MKYGWPQIFCLFIIAFLQTTVVAYADTYQLDAEHSYVLWHISHFDFSHPSGRFPATGTLILDEAKPAMSRVNITIPIADLATGVPELDKHLKSELFFDLKQFPTATFVSDKITVTSPKTALVHGILTLHGISHPVLLKVTLNKIGENPVTEQKTLGFSASTTINRSDFNIDTLLPGVGDEVTIQIEVEAIGSNL